MGAFDDLIPANKAVKSSPFEDLVPAQNLQAFRSAIVPKAMAAQGNVSMQNGIPVFDSTPGQNIPDTVSGSISSFLRPLAPYAAAAGAGALVGGPPGAVAGPAILGMSKLASNLVVPPINAVTGNKYNIQTGDQVMNNGMNALHIPGNPQTDHERVLSAIGGGIGDAAGNLGLGSAIQKGLIPIAGKMGSSLGRDAVSSGLLASPAAQIASGAAGGGVGQALQNSGASPGVQMAGSLLGGLAPAGANAFNNIPALIRKVPGLGFNPDQANNTISEFLKNTGTNPTLAQATGNKAYGQLESALGVFPGGAGPIVRKADQQKLGLSNKLNGMANDLTPSSNVQEAVQKAGSAVQSGIPQGMAKAKNAGGDLYDQYRSMIDPDGQWPVDSYSDMLDQMISGNPKVSATQKILQPNQSGYLKSLKDALVSDSGNKNTMNPGQVDALIQQFSDKVNASKAPGQLISDPFQAQNERLLGSLKDIRSQIASGTSPQAQQALDEANKNWAMIHDNADIMQGATGAKTPEAAYAAATTNPTTFNTVLNHLPPDQQKTFLAAKLKQLGMVSPGEQDSYGEGFSPARMVTNWAKFGGQNQQSIAKVMGPDYLNNLQSLVNTSGDIKDSQKIFANASGTAGKSALIANLGVLGSAATQGLGPLSIAAGGTIGAPNILSRIVTNPTAVRWMANNAKNPVEPGVALNALTQMATRLKDPEALQIAKELKDYSQPDEQPDSAPGPTVTPAAQTSAAPPSDTPSASTSVTAASTTPVADANPLPAKIPFVQDDPKYTPVRTTTYNGADDKFGAETAKPGINGQAMAHQGITIAVDPKVIPYGSYVHIPGLESQSAHGDGIFYAHDTGSAVVSKAASKGKTPVIDVYTPSSDLDSFQKQIGDTNKYAIVPPPTWAPASTVKAATASVPPVAPISLASPDQSDSDVNNLS